MLRVLLILAALLIAAPAEARQVIGQQKVLVMMLNFNNTTQPTYTVAQVQGRMATGNNYVIESSYGLASLSYTVVNWQTMNLVAPASGCVLSSISSEGDRLTALQGINVASYQHKVYLLPAYSSTYCTSGEVDLNPGRVWVESNALPSWNTITHEIVHNFGSRHAQAWDCGTVALDVPANCLHVESGAYADLMGTGPTAHTNAITKERFGWLTATDVLVNGDYTIKPMSAQVTGAHALSIPLSDGRSLYVEYRQPTGFDSQLGQITGQNISKGLKLTVDHLANSNTYMLDATPLSSVLTTDGALEVGKSFSWGGVTVTCLSLNATQAVVRVSFP